MSFVHLRLHSEFSLIDSLVRVGDAVKQCQKHKMPALALTDLGNLYGLVKFYKAAQGKGMKMLSSASKKRQSVLRFAHEFCSLTPT
jgi:DNA polymerase-3 subunit alpha